MPFPTSRATTLACAILTTACYESFSPSDGIGGPGPGDASATTDASVEADAALPIERSEGYELNHDRIPVHPWLDAPPSGASCWPVSYAPSFSSEAITNLEHAVRSWDAACSRFCFGTPMVRATLDDRPHPSLEGIATVVLPDAGTAQPNESGASGHGIFGELRTESVTIHVGPGRTPSVREWARALGIATGLRVTSDGLRDGLSSVLRSDLPPGAGATPTDRGALCRFFPR